MAEKTTKPTSFSLDLFKKASEAMIATNDAAYNNWSKYGERFGGIRGQPNRDYTKEEIEAIIDNGSISQQSTLSRQYFNKNGFYKRIILYYATFLKYTGILIPSPASGKSITTPSISDKYFKAMDFYERLALPTLATHIALRVLIDGSYYGVIQSMNKDAFAMLDLPYGYCRSNFKDEYGNDIIEFNVAYFDTIFEKAHREAALRTYPKEISSYYKSWSELHGGISNWMFIPTDIGVSFQFTDSRPFFLHILPSTLDYENSVDREAEKEIEEIKKIIVQKIPHLNDGELLFQPNEAEAIHKGTVEMLKKSNPNVSVLTTYGDIDTISSKTTADGVNNSSMDRMKNNIYSEAGASPQIFAATGNLAIENSLKNDLSLVMILGNKFSIFVTNLINRYFGNSNISFKFTLLPISYYNEKDYIEDAYKMVNTGYSLILPAIAMGLSQKDLGSIKNLENDLLKLNEKLIPPISASTMSGDDAAGRPSLDDDKKSDKTIKNETAQNGGEG